MCVRRAGCLSFLGKYFYRNQALRHLRVEQSPRFYWNSQVLFVLSMVFAVVMGVGWGCGATGSTDIAC